MFGFRTDILDIDLRLIVDEVDWEALRDWDWAEVAVLVEQAGDRVL